MFISKEKHDLVANQLQAMQEQRTAFLNALGLDPEKTENDAVITAIQNTLQAKDTAEDDLKTEKAEKTTAVNALNAVISDLDDLGETVKAAKTPTEKVEAVRTLLAEKPGASNTAGNSKKDEIDTPADGVDQAALDALPHNREADSMGY
jgi:hypothetical protein